MIYAYNRTRIVIPILFILGIICTFLFIVNPLNRNDAPKLLVPIAHNDLNAIQKRKQLIALTDNSSTSFYLYKGDSMGYEYELLNMFAQKMGLELKMVVAKDMNEIFKQLNNGDVDIVAANLTITKERLNIVDFTEPFCYVPQVLIQRKPTGWENMTRAELDENLIRNVVDLNGKNIAVRKGSSFYSRLISLSEEIGEKINIVEVSGQTTTEELISQVADGQIDYTIADENVALSNQTYYSNIDVGTPVSFPQKIAWAVRKDSPQLLAALNTWISNRKNTKEDQKLFAKYFKAHKKSTMDGRGSYVSYNEGIISQYDDLIKTYSKKIDWDWHLLAAMIYQESHFSPTARSWAGANGFMQLIPATAKYYGLDTIDATAEQSLQAGVNYLIDIDEYWRGKVKNKNERIKFVLASYNSGLGHVIDARNLASKYGMNPNVWYDNVETMILQKSNPTYYNDPVVRCGYCRGQEPYYYVREIMKRYTEYRKIPDAKEVLASN